MGQRPQYRPCRAAPKLVGRGRQQRPDLPLGRALWRSGRRSAQRPRRSRPSRRAKIRGFVSRCVSLELQRLPSGRNGKLRWPAACRLPPRSICPWWPTHPTQFPNPDDFEAHEARVCIAGGWVLADKSTAPNLRRASFVWPEVMAEALCRFAPKRCKIRWKSPSAAISTSRWAKNSAQFPRPTACAR